MWSWQESNLHFSLRRGVSYPLNDKTVLQALLTFRNIHYFSELVKKRLFLLPFHLSERPSLEFFDRSLAADRALGLRIVEVRHAAADALVVGFERLLVSVVVPDLEALYRDIELLLELVDDRIHGVAMRALAAVEIDQ